jgi:hypothetical protein
MTLVHRGMLLMTVFAAFWASEEALMAFVADRYAVIQIVWLRFAFHVAALFALCGWRRPASLWRTRRPGFQLARSLFLAAMPSCWALGMQGGGDPRTMLSVFWLSPLLILGLVQWWLRERVSFVLWLAVAAGSIAASVMLGPEPLPGIGLLAYPLSMAVAFSLYVVMTMLLRAEAIRTNLFYAGLGVVLVLAPLMPGVWVSPEPADLVVIFGVAMICLLGLLTLERLAAAGPLAPVLPFVYLQLVFSAGLAWIAGAEPGWRGVLGSVLITFVAAVLWKFERRRQVSLRAPAMAYRETQ